MTRAPPTSNQSIFAIKLIVAKTCFIDSTIEEMFDPFRNQETRGFPESVTAFSLYSYEYIEHGA